MSGQGLRRICAWGQGLPNNTKVEPDVGVANQTAQRKYEKNAIAFVIFSGGPKKDLKSRNQKVYVSKTNQTSKTESSHYTNSMTLRHCEKQDYDTPKHTQKNIKPHDISYLAAVGKRQLKFRPRLLTIAAFPWSRK